MATELTSAVGMRPRSGRALQTLAAAAGAIVGFRRCDLEPGDRLVVATRNSIYQLIADEDGKFTVSGGWFERQGIGQEHVAVAGCTAGGHALFTDLLAAPGMFLEFGNGAVTTRILHVRRLRRTEAAAST
jgi:hypothetical protein